MMIKSKDPKNPNRTLFVGNMADLLLIVHDAKQQMIAEHGVEEGTELFGKLKAKEVLEQYCVDAGSSIH